MNHSGLDGQNACHRGGLQYNRRPYQYLVVMRESNSVRRNIEHLDVRPALEAGSPQRDQNWKDRPTNVGWIVAPRYRPLPNILRAGRLR